MPIAPVAPAVAKIHTSALRTPMGKMTIDGGVIFERIMTAKSPEAYKAMCIKRGIDPAAKISKTIVEELHQGRFNEEGTLTDKGLEWIRVACTSILKGTEHQNKKPEEVYLRDFIRAYFRPLQQYSKN